MSECAVCYNIDPAYLAPGEPLTILRTELESAAKNGCELCSILQAARKQATNCFPLSYYLKYIILAYDFQGGPLVI